MLKKILSYTLGAATVVVAAVWLDSGYRLSWWAVEWANSKSAPFQVSDNLELATYSYPFKRASMSILCGPGGSHLMLRYQIPLGSRYREGYRITKVPHLHTEVIFDWRRVPGGITNSSFKTKSTVVELGNVDTVITAALSAGDRQVLLDWFNRGAPQGVSVGFGEFGSPRLQSVSSAKAVAVFLKRCR